MNEIEAAKVRSAKRMIEQDGLAKAKRLVREDKRDPEALKQAMEELTAEVDDL